MKRVVPGFGRRVEERHAGQVREPIARFDRRRAPLVLDSGLGLLELLARERVPQAFADRQGADSHEKERPIVIGPAIKAIRIVEVRQPVKLRRGGHIRLAALVQSPRDDVRELGERPVAIADWELLH